MAIANHALLPPCSYLQDGCIELSNTSLSSVARGCPRLSELNVTRCVKINDSGVSEIIRGCEALTLLQVNLCPAMTDDYIMALRRRYHDLSVVRSLGAYSSATESGILDNLPVPFDPTAVKKPSKKKGKKGKKGKGKGKGKKKKR